MNMRRAIYVNLVQNSEKGTLQRGTTHLVTPRGVSALLIEGSHELQKLAQELRLEEAEQNIGDLWD